MRSLVSSACYAAHPEKVLAVRGGAMRTFAGLAIFLTLCLLCLGVYLIQDQFAEPLGSYSSGLFTAAVVLATAMTLLYELVQLPRSVWRNAAKGRTALLLRTARVVSVARRVGRPQYKQRHAQRHQLRHQQRTDLPYQRSYVDRVRVRV
jgi:hypothetical protein